jgi:hypothetical protein
MFSQFNGLRLFTLVLVLAVISGYAGGRILPATALVSAAPVSQSLAQEGIPGPDNQAGLPASEAAPTVPDVVPPTTPGTAYKTYSGTCFTPHGTENGATNYAGGGGVYRVSGSNEYDCLLELPQGARVTEIVFYVRDDATSTIDLWFSIYQPDSGSFANVTGTNTSGADSSAIIQRKLSGSPITTIDNTRYQYILEVVLRETTNQHVIFGARVGYRMTSVLPVVESSKH